MRKTKMKYGEELRGILTLVQEMRVWEFSKTFFDECCYCERQGSLA